MKDDPILKDIRKFRDELSERFEGDLSKIFAYFKQEEVKSGRTFSTQKNPRVLVHPEVISPKTMEMMDQSVGNLKKGKASNAVDLNELDKLLE